MPDCEGPISAQKKMGATKDCDPMHMKGVDDRKGSTTDAHELKRVRSLRPALPNLELWPYPLDSPMTPAGTHAMARP